MLSAKRVRPTPQCVLHAARAILSDAAGPLVTTDDARRVVVDARVRPVRVRHVTARVLAIAESVRRAAAGAFVSTERVLCVAERALVSLEDVLVAPARAVVCR